MKNIFLETENVQKFREAASVIDDLEKGQPGLCVVYGQAGRGKTLCSREYAVRTGAVYLRVQEDWTPRAMLSSLCFEINGIMPGSVEKCKQMLFSELEVSPKAIVVDEADRFRNVGMLEHFRDLHDITGCPVMFVGERVLYKKVNSKRRIWSRVVQVVEFGPISVQDIQLFGLKAAELKIKKDAAERLRNRSEGDFRLIWQDVRALERMAMAVPTKDIEEEMVLKLRNRRPKPLR